jgi:SAM-dependent methyltransferase
LFRLKHGTEHLNYGSDILREWTLESLKRGANLRILDVHVSAGINRINAASLTQSKQVRFFGIMPRSLNDPREFFEEMTMVRADVENESFPFESGFFDIVIANQLLDRIGNILHVFDEFSRVLKFGGQLFIGVPNLASFHNRMALLFGEQPTCLEFLGPHVRGITAPSLKRFVTHGGLFRLRETKGSNFYPFPEFASRRLSKLFPTLSVSIFFRLERTDKLANLCKQGFTS